MLNGIGWTRRCETAKIVKTYWGIVASPEDIRPRAVMMGRGRGLKLDICAVGSACDDGPVLFDRKYGATDASYPELGETVIKLRVTYEEV